MLSMLSASKARLSTSLALPRQRKAAEKVRQKKARKSAATKVKRRSVGSKPKAKAKPAPALSASSVGGADAQPAAASKPKLLSKKRLAKIAHPVIASKIVWSECNVKRSEPGRHLIKEKLNAIRLTEADKFPNNPSVKPASGILTSQVGKAGISWVRLLAEAPKFFERRFLHKRKRQQNDYGRRLTIV